MKIVDVAEFYAPLGGGVKTYVDQKIALAASHGHAVTVIAPGPENRTEEREGGKVIWVKAPVLPLDKRYHVFWNAEDVHRVLDAEQPDVLEASSPWRGAWIAAGWRGDAKRVLFMHADPVASYPHQWLGGALRRDQIDRLFGWFWNYLRRLASRFDEVVVGGDWLAQRLAGQGVAQPRVATFGIDTRLFSPRKRSPALRAEWLAKTGLGPDAALLLGIGRHHPEKRWPMVIEAANAAQASRPVGLLLVGDGLSRTAVDRAAANAAHVHVAGQIGDRALIARLLASADALIHGCSSETFGLVAAEALASGTPLIVPSVGGCSALAHPDWSETYEPGSRAGATAAINRLLARNPDALRHAAIAAGRTRVAPAGRHFDALFDMYGELVGGYGWKKGMIAA
ncbi:glycosyltransferase [Sandaracinobacteroides saxicola]|uniref:Glycosyltransferase n=2 Tax=Sandaracinobacteroides saxicola TaxID=2759707 RepID=A0A7G5IMX1_9SPHN|nr:glycosyltransferase [Sandaracinobacteroides saxicola]